MNAPRLKSKFPLRTFDSIDQHPDAKPKREPLSSFEWLPLFEQLKTYLHGSYSFVCKQFASFSLKPLKVKASLRTPSKSTMVVPRKRSRKPRYQGKESITRTD